MPADSEACNALSSVGDALRWAIRELTPLVETPRLDAEVLLAHVLGVSRVQLHVRWRDTILRTDLDYYRGIVLRRMQHEPVAYLVGHRAFYDIDLVVNRHVLIPRPETEHLIEQALAWVDENGHASLLVADIGTGSGALATVLGGHIAHARVVAVDISPDALAVARCNVSRHGLDQRVMLVCSDLLEALPCCFDLVVANLPYVSASELALLPTGIMAYEPCLALDGGDDGLDTVRRLLEWPNEWLACPGLALFEIDPRQSHEVARMARKRYPDARITIVQDLAGRDRVIRVQRVTSGL